MAQGTYTDFPTVATSDTWTAAQHNTYLRDNLGYLLSMAEPTMTNKSGSTRSQGDLVKVDTSNDSSFTTTTTASDTGTFGVVASASIANNSTGRVAVGGIVTIQTTGTVTRGDYLESSTSAGKAKSAGTTKTGATFAMALTTASGGVCTALILPSVTGLTGAYCRAYHSTTQSIANTTETALVFDTERNDTDGFHSTSVNTSRFTVPTGKAGFYSMMGSAALAVNGSTSYAKIKVNGTTVIAYQPAILLTVTYYNIEAMYYLSDGDYVEMYVYQSGGIAYNISSTANYSPEFSIAKVG